MSLKQVFHKWVSDFAPMHDVAADGLCLVYGVTGSGFPLGDNKKTVRLAASSSGTKSAGILTQKFIVLDETLYKKNFWNNEQVTGYPAEVIRKGEVYIDSVTDTTTAVGDPAYLTSSGFLTKTLVGTVQTPLVGQFQGTKDENGFVKVFIELP